ncbi:sarcolemmal membrane-associated protein [Wolffia australiana]
MSSRGRHQPYPRQPQPTMINPEPFVPDLRLSQRPRFFDMAPPPEIMEQKLIFQHSEMQKLAHENHRLGSSQVILRQDLASAQQELHRLQAQINLMKAEKEQTIKGLQDKMAGIEAELRVAEPINVELQQAHAEAQTLLSVRQELISRVQQLTQQLKLSQAELQQIPPLLSELEGLRREYHNFRLTYDHERKFYSDHLDSLQLMEKNYVAMLKEVEKLRNELANTTSSDRRAGGQYGTNVGYQGAESYTPNMSMHAAPAQLSAIQNPRDDAYNAHQGRIQNVGASSMGDYRRGTGLAQAGYEVGYGNPRGGGGSSGTSMMRGGYDASWASGYELSAGEAAAGYETAARPGAMIVRNVGGGSAATDPQPNGVGDRDQVRTGGMVHQRAAGLCSSCQASVVDIGLSSLRKFRVQHSDNYSGCNHF